MSRVRKTIVVGTAFAAIWLFLCAVIGILAVEGALHPSRLHVGPTDESRVLTIARRNSAEIKDVALVTTDGVTLRAWSLRPSPGNGDAVILLHGQGDNRAGMLGNAEMLLRHGYAVLLPDARAHGASGGQIATYGVSENEDIRDWVEWLERSNSPHCIDGLGDSMGGAELLNSLSTESNFCAVVAESSFATFQEAAYDRLGQEFQAGPWVGRTLLRPALEAGLIYARLRYGVDLRQASPERSVAASRTPVLLIHGLADTNLPPRHSEMIRGSNANVVLWEPAHANHCGASGAEPEEYERRVLEWFDMHRRH